MQIGRLPRLYNFKDKRPIERYCLDVWPGYSCEVKYLIGGIFLNVDLKTTIFYSATIADKIREL